MSVHSWFLSFPMAFCLALAGRHASGAEQLYQIGVAKVDITPTYPIRLTGYAARNAESEDVVPASLGQGAGQLAVTKRSQPC